VWIYSKLQTDVTLDALHYVSNQEHLTHMDNNVLYCLPLLTTFKVSNGFSLEILINFRAKLLLQTIAVETEQAFQTIPETEGNPRNKEWPEGTTSQVKSNFSLFIFQYNYMLFLTEHHAMKVYCESGGIPPHILDSSTSWPSHFTPRGRAPGTHWIGG